jgi:hypothetical protein
MGYKSTGTLHLKRFVNQQLAGLKTEVAQKAAAEIADEITRQARASFDGGQTVYGDARPTGVHGPLSLVKTGTTRDSLRFSSDGGTKVRAVLGNPYMKYLIGKYVILPIGNAALPFSWLTAIRSIFAKYAARQLEAKRAA